MADRVAEVQHLTAAIVVAVFLDEFLLLKDAPQDDFFHMIPEIFLASDIFQKLEELRIADASVLQGFCEAVMDVAHGKRIEEVGVDEDTLWLVESTRQILAAGKVDGDFSADRAVDLRKNRRRHLEEGHASHVGSRRKSAKVARDAAREGDDCIVP